MHVEEIRLYKKLSKIRALHFSLHYIYSQSIFISHKSKKFQVGK